jgi:YfiR/HmsC-like
VEALMAPSSVRLSRWAIAGVIAATVAVRPAAAASETASAATLKAALLYNVAKFIEWPADALPAAEPLTICVAGDRAVADALDDMVRGRAIGGHGIALRRTKLDDGSLRTCHVLYVSDVDERRTLDLIDGLAGAAMLTASDLTGFAQLGGVAHFFVENGKMRFAINLQSAQRARLNVSSKLLGLAMVVKDGRNGSRH